MHGTARLRLLAAWVLVVAALAACGAGDSPSRGETPRQLVVGAGEDISPSGAFQARLGVYPLNVNVAETLTRLTPDYRVEPLLATRWEYRGGGTWRFVLRQDVRFHDGRPLDARAVQRSLSRAVRDGFGYGAMTENSMRVVNDSTVDITTAEPDLRLPEQLVHPNYSIFAPGTDPGVEPVGTGPFRFVEYTADERFVVGRNPEYWGRPARLDRLTFRFYPDATTRVLALLAGEVDVVMDLPREQVAAIADRADLRVARAPVGQMLNLNLNIHGRGPYDLLADRRLRRAIGLAIDRRGLIEMIWTGEGAEVQGMTVPEILGAHAAGISGFDYAPRRAAQMLDSAGWSPGPDGVRSRQGRRLRLTLLAHPSIAPGTVEFIQAQLRSVGIEARWVRFPDTGSYAERLNTGAFDMNLSVPNQNDGNPLFLPALIFHSDSERPFARWHHVGERFDRLVDAGRSSADPEEARRLAASAIRIAMDERTAVISIAGRYRLYALKTTVRGFTPHPAQTHQSWASVRITPADVAALRGR